MIEVKVWQTNDGELFSSKVKASEHEDHLLYLSKRDSKIKELRNVVEVNLANRDFTTDDIICVIVDYLLEEEA